MKKSYPTVLLRQLLHSIFSSRPRFWQTAGIGLLQALSVAVPAFGAELVYANYGPIERSISVEALATYARTGELTPELEGYSRYLTAEQLAQLRTGLLASADLDVVAVSQFLYTPQGEAILENLGEVIQTAGRRNGAKAIRGAVIVATADADGGLNVLNFLKHFPTEGVRVNLRQLSQVARLVISEINQTSQTVDQIQQQANQVIDALDIQYSLASQVILASAGEFRWEKQTFTQTSLTTDLYLPEGQNAPLVVISHGLGGNRSTLAYIAEHLASHGFAVTVVEHPGSSENQVAALLSGQASEGVDPAEMTQRPVAIRNVLNELEALAQENLQLKRQINFERIGTLGQSMGAYTSLALSGATLNLSRLENSCPPQVAQLNISLLLQCLIPSLPMPLPSLRDRRIRASFTINPLGSAAFGPEGMANIKVPIMMVSGSADTVTPALSEQIRPFSWLTFPQRYLLLMEGGTHFSTIFDPMAVDESVPVPEIAIGPSSELAQRYIKITSVAFFKVYLNNDASYRQYLSPAYINTLSKSDIPLTLVQELRLDDP